MTLNYKEYLIKEGLNPLEVKDKPITISTWVKSNYQEFLNDLLNEIKKLIGQTIYFEGERRYDRMDQEKEPVYKINGKIVRPFYKIKVKDIAAYGTNHKTIIIISEDDKRYILYKLANKKSYDNFQEKIKKEKEINENLENSIGKTIYFYGDRVYGWRLPKEEKDPVYKLKGKEIKTVHKYVLKSIKHNPRNIIITTEDGKEYYLKKLLDKKAYDRFYKRAESVIKEREEMQRKKEEMKDKMRYIDPYGEENWIDEPKEGKWY